MTTADAGQAWDVFVSHASEDKDAVARPLAAVLRTLGLKVWYDEFSLKLGDSLSRSIDRGLAESRFGVVILSPDFMAKGWPERELAGLVARTVDGRCNILPVWHNITREQVLAYSPTLADTKAVVLAGQKVERAALEISRVASPDTLSLLYRRLKLREHLDASSEARMVPISELKRGPVLYKELPAALLARLRLVRAALAEVCPYPMSWWVDNTSRDWDPANEVRLWEHIAACYLEALQRHVLSEDERHAVFSMFVRLSLGFGERDSATGLPAHVRDDLLRLFDTDPANDAESVG